MSTYPAGVEIHRGAQISSCEQYRYVLARWWGDGPRLNFIMCNPSTADDQQDDNTIRRCVSFAVREGCDGIGVFNLYAFRATKPANMWAAAKAGVEITGGQRNDDLLTEVRRQWGVQPVVAAWGAHPKPERINEVLAMWDSPLLSLGVTKAGAPRHPLMVRADAPIVSWSRP